MTIEVSALAAWDDLVACERFQRQLLGEPPGGALLGVPALRAIVECGGLVLGVRANRVTPELVAAAVDLPGTYERFPALFSLFFAVAETSRGQGVGQALRLAERRAALALGVEVVRSWVDPLRSREGHVWWDRLGAIGTGYERNVLGDLADRVHRGLATDRVSVEWWLRSPRTSALLESGRPAAHLRAPLHEMAVVTRTAADASGLRILAGTERREGAEHVLFEIPSDIDRLREENPAEARRWRLETRDAFEWLVGSGYLFVGLLHEGGRSFHVLEKAGRSTVLGRDEDGRVVG